MGAIAAVRSREGPPQLEAVERMVAAAPHRGTQATSLLHERCALACVTDPAAPDAWLARDQGLSVAFTGILDNAREMAASVGRASGRPVDEGDLAALLAAAFRVHGEELPRLLRGVYAIAITDGARLWCFRDHVGYRPLFYREDSAGLFVASEAKQVVAGARIGREPDLDTVEAIFFRTVTDDTPSALLGVRRLPKATLLGWDGDRLTSRRYWHPETLLETARLRPDELRERFVAAMDTAVGRVLTGHDAISLSGGIDSPAIAAFAAGPHLERGGRPLTAMTVAFPRFPTVDETRYVRLVAERLGLPLHVYEQTANPLADLARWTALADSPFHGASLAQYEEDYLRARALGIRTVLTGEHAEFVAAMHWNTLDHLLTHGRWRAARRLLAARRARGESPVALARLVARAVSPDRLLDLRNRLARRRPASVPAWMDAGMAAEDDPVPVRQRWRQAQLLAFMGPGIALEAEEVCQATTGVRARRPWTDVDLWELFLSLPAEVKFPDLRIKGLVRDLLRGRVPDEVLDRRDKTVFDEAAMAEIDYAVLRRYLGNPGYRVRGVDYGLLRDLLEREALSALDLVWARELANTHAFLSQWTA